MVKNDFKRNKVINVSLFLFMMFSAILAVLSLLMAVQTFKSINELYQVAQPPHFLQMHKGEINHESINKFMSEQELVTYSQTVTMINVYGDNIAYIGKDNSFNLSDCRLDIGLVKQNEHKDLLLNSQHEKVNLKPGEIGIPVLLKEMYNMKLEGRVILTGNNIKKEFVIKEFILDSQMNSSMASSTRILLSDNDYNELNGETGENEYLIEAYFPDTSDANTFKTAYEDANLPQNGQAVTYSIIFLLSAMTDIVTVFVMLVSSMFLIIVSFICVRFTIMAALEEEVAEIGTMKAIGIKFKDIRDFYLQKYTALSLAGVSLGYVIALLISNIFTRHISSTFGNMKLSFMTIILSLAAAIIVFILINIYCKKTLRKIKKITVVDALVTGKGFNNEKSSVKDTLHKSKKLSINWIMGLRDIFYNFKSWSVVFIVVLIAVMIIMIPVNLLNTFESPEFITYMGSSREDILIEVENGDNLEAGYSKVKELLKNNGYIADYYEYATVRVKVTNKDNVYMNMNVDTGINAGNGLQYMRGEAPEGNNEIAISYLNAEEIGKDVGDELLVLYNGKELVLAISGVYQDVTSGGLTAKSKFDFVGLSTNKYSFSVNLKDNSLVKEIADEWSKKLGMGVSVDPMEEFINQTLGGVSEQLKKIVFSIGVVGLCLAMLITVLFLKLRLAKDLSQIATLKALGFSEVDIKKQYMIKIGSASLLGIVVGIILTNALGEKIVNGALSLSGLGIKEVKLISNVLLEYFVCPLLLIVLILWATWIVIKTIEKYEIMSIIKE